MILLKFQFFIYKSLFLRAETLLYFHKFEGVKHYTTPIHFKMLSFLFLICEWLASEDFSIGEYFEGSPSAPVFAAILSKSRRSKRLNLSLFDFANKLGNKVNVKFTSIQCAEKDFCHKYAVARTPQFVLMRGKNKKYWRFTEESDAAGWSNFIRNEMSPLVYEMENDSVDDLEEKLKFGGSFFIAKIKEGDEEIINKLYEMSASYRMYHATFAFMRVNNTNTSEIISYYSTSCSERTNVTDKTIDSFINKRLYSAYHTYDNREFRDASTGNLVLYVGHDSKQDIIQKVTMLTKLSNCRNDVIFGAASLSRDRYIAELANKRLAIEPYVVGFNFKKECYVVTAPNSSMIKTNEFYAELEGGAECKKFEQEENPQIGSINNFWFVYFLIALLLLSIAIYIVIFSYHELSALKMRLKFL